MNENFATRLRKAMDLRQMKAVDLANKTGIDRGSISHYMNGSYKPSGNNTDKLAEALGVDTAWLMGYDVPMTRSNPDQPVSDEVLKFALFGGEQEITDAQLEEVKRFAKFVKERDKKDD
jgi:transcriptional regulator with XRE-family HTH domain